MPLGALYAGSISLTIERSPVGGGIVRAPNIEMSPGIPVSGRVLDATTGDASTDVDVNLSYRRDSPEHDYMEEIDIDPDGSFAFLEAPGLLTVDAACKNCDVVSGSETQQLILDSEHSHEDLIIQVKPYDTFSCFVYTTGRLPAVGARVHRAWQETYFVTGNDGIAQVGLPAADFGRERPQTTVFLAEMVVSDEKYRGAAGTVVSSPEATSVEIELQPTASMSGVVVDSAGAPMAGAHVSCRVKVEDHTFVEGAMVTGVDGRYVFKGVLSGFPASVRAGGVANRIDLLPPGADLELPAITFVEFKADGSSMF
jgi:hypothetical protein